jgi:hypothetical protein
MTPSAVLITCDAGLLPALLTKDLSMKFAVDSGSQDTVEMLRWGAGIGNLGWDMGP